MGAILAKEVLEELGYDLKNIIRSYKGDVMHEEDEGVIPDAIAAALVLADKADVHRSRVRNPAMVTEDIHDRVNYAATESELLVNCIKNLLYFSLVIDTRIR